MESEVVKYYDGKCLFITGSTGFMGKVLVEKLLYSCPGIQTIYLLLRPKRGKAIETRLDEMTKIPLFNRIREECKERFSKLVAIPGDVGSEEMGISKEDQERLKRDVHIVIHGAASLRLDAKLKDAINMNTEGTLRLIRLALEMPKLEVLMHTSTAFCHVDIDPMEERVYPAPVDPMDMIKLCHWMDDSIIEKITTSLMKPHPNAYTYSKRLAEAVIAKYYPQLPVVIVRPSIVTPAWREPLSGWVDNLNGPIGLTVGAGKGVIRSMHCNADYNAEVIPVDLAINGMIAIAKKIGSSKERPANVPVFNLTQSSTKPITWGEVVEKGKQVAYKNPFEMMLWFPNGNIYKSKAVHDISVVLFHWIPAYLIDFLMLIFRQKRFMIKIQTRIQDGLNVLQYFTTRQWQFSNKELIAVRESMNSVDKELFTLDFEKIDPVPYLTDCVLGARQYLMKEDPSTLPRCRRNLKMLWFLDKVVTVLFYMLLLWFIVSFSDTAKTIMDSALGCFSSVPFVRSIKQ